jgi:hypothetical protein
MEKIRNKIKSKETFDKMMKVLIERIQNNKPISDNPMLDGMIIGFIVSTNSFTRDLFMNKFLGNVLDGTLQKLEHIVIWVTDNEDKLIEILENDIK